MTRTLAALLLLFPAGFQDDAVAAKNAVDALLDLEESDEEGFDAQADVLLKLGEKALDVLEPAVDRAPGPKKFRLIRIRDMMWYPITVTGAYSDTETARSKEVGFQHGDIKTAFNGQAVRNNFEYSRALEAAEKQGLTTATVDVIRRGRRKIVTIPGLRVGGTIREYPHYLAYYVHQGQRSPAWDEDVKSGLSLWLGESSARTLPLMSRAIRAGCRDPIVVNDAVFDLVAEGRADEAVALWTSVREGLKTRLYRGDRTRYAMYSASRAMLETGNLDEAVKLAEASLQGHQESGELPKIGFAKGYLGLLLQDREPARALDLLRAGVPETSENGAVNFWLASAKLHVLRNQGKWEETGQWLRLYDDYRHYLPASAYDACRLLREHGTTKVVVPRRRLFSSETSEARGVGDGLLGEYFNNKALEGTPVRRRDPIVNFIWRAEPVAGIPKDDFSVRWSGRIEPEFTDTYTFTVRADDGCRLWVDGRMIVDRWVGQPSTDCAGQVDLKAGKRVDVKLEYFEGGGGAQADLCWDCPSFRTRRGDGPWALAMRHTFDVDLPVESVFDLVSEERDDRPAIRGGALKYAGDSSVVLDVTWESYEAVRLEADLRISPAKDRSSRDRKVGLSAGINSSREWGVGGNIWWPRYYGIELYGFPASWCFSPFIDLDQPTRFALEMRRGAAITHLGGKVFTEIVYPSHWGGRGQLRSRGTPFEANALEVWVPADRGVDNDRIRACYDEAGRRLKASDANGALASLEEAAELQTHVAELARLYAAYVSKSGLKVDALRARLRDASHPRRAALLLLAEVHLDLVADPEADDLPALRAVKRATDEGQEPAPAQMAELEGSSRTARRAVHARAVETRWDYGRATFEAAEAAHRSAVAKDPGSAIHAAQLARFLRTWKRDPSDALRRVAEAAPKIDAAAVVDELR